MNKTTQAPKSAKLIIVRGLPGSGKSTLARQMVADGRADWHVETDQIIAKLAGREDWELGEYTAEEFTLERQAEAIRLVKAGVAESLARGERVLVAGVFSSAAKYEHLRQMALSAGAEFEVITLTARFQTIHPIPAITLADMAKKFEV